MKKSKKGLCFIDTGIFPATIMVSCGFNYSEIKKILTKKKASDWLAGLSEDEQFLQTGNWKAMKRVIEYKKFGKRTMFYIIIPELFDFSDHHYCLLAHEVLHICQFFLPDVLERGREIEAEAYLHTHIMKNCLMELRK